MTISRGITYREDRPSRKRKSFNSRSFQLLSLSLSPVLLWMQYIADAKEFRMILTFRTSHYHERHQIWAIRRSKLSEIF